VTIHRAVLLRMHEIAAQLDITKARWAAGESGRPQPRNVLAIARELVQLSGVPAAWILGIDEPGHSAPEPATESGTRINRG
jgi:hypothetical protein